jgi:hypothetical protein
MRVDKDPDLYAASDGQPHQCRDVVRIDGTYAYKWGYDENPFLGGSENLLEESPVFCEGLKSFGRFAFSHKIFLLLIGLVYLIARRISH